MCTYKVECNHVIRVLVVKCNCPFHYSASVLTSTRSHGVNDTFQVNKLRMVRTKFIQNLLNNQ